MEIPKSLKEQLRAGKVIPFIGAGVSMAVKDKNTGKRLFPSWKELLERAANRMDEEGHDPNAGVIRSLLRVGKADEYLEAARRARKGLVGTIWSKFMKEQFDIDPDRADAKSLDLPQAVWKLGSRLIITTNYDRVLHWVCPQLNQLMTWDIEAPAEQSSALRQGLQRPTVWHLHGYIDNAVNMILTPDGYGRLYPEDEKVKKYYEAALATLRHLLTTHTFLFIGFSLDDERFGLQLSGLNEIFHGETGPHYALVHAKNVERVKLLKLPVLPIDFEDFGEPLLNRVLELVSIAEAGTEEKSKESPSGASAASYDPRNAPFYVPYTSKGDQVIGREETLQAVREQLANGRRTAIGQTALFQGLGGLGKTQLAVEYAYRYRSSYSNGVVWLNADQDIDAQLTDLAEKARWIAPESEHKHKLDIAQQRLRAYSDCLIIFDNVESPGSIDKYLPDPQTNPHILITSRTEQSGFTRVPVHLLDHELSVKLLLQEAGPNQEPKGEAELEAAREVAKALDGLPLALELAGAYIQYREITWQQYRDLLTKNLRAALPKKHIGFTRHETDLYSTLKINEEVFEEEPRLRDILDLLTWSGSAPMGLSLMCALLGAQESTELISALGLGRALRLLQKSADSESYAIHRLVREVRREDIPLARQEDWINSICQRTGDWFQERRARFEDLPDFEAEIDHLLVWQQHAQLYAPEHSSRLIWLQAYPPYHRGRFQEVKVLVEKALKLFDQVKGNDRQLEAHLFNDLGFSYSALGESKRALEYEEKALAINLELFGERHPDTANSLNSVGSSYSRLGDHKRALEYKERALAIQVELFGERHPDTANSLSTVGSTYGELGDHRRALEYEERALAIQVELFGERHPDTANSFNSVGMTYGELGDYKRALEYQEKALAINLELFGERHPNTAASFNNLGLVYSGLSDHKRALEYKERALAIQVELFGERHPYTATSFNNVGMTYDDLGDHKRALEYKEKALKLRRELLGEKHPDTAVSISNVAYSLVMLNRRLEAFQLVDRFFNKLPKDHPRYDLLKQRRQEIQAGLHGFRSQPVNKQKAKKKKKKR